MPMHPTERQIAEYAAGHLSKEERDRIAEHCLTCPDCIARVMDEDTLRDISGDDDELAGSAF